MTENPRQAQNILVIEPDPGSAAYLDKLLKRAGYQVSLCSTGKDGLIKAWRDQPDIIVLELDLPDVDSLEIVRRLRRDPRTERKTIISLTARSLPEDAVAGLEAGLDYYILKQADSMDVLFRYLQRERPASGTGPLDITTRAGTVIAFISAKGGVGTSSLCLNIASAIARRRPSGQVGVVDLTLPMGTLAAISGAATEIDVVDATHFEPSTLTPDLLRKQMPALPGWGFSILPGTLSPSRAPDLRPDRIAPLLQSLRAAFAVSVIDLGRTLSRLSLYVLSQSSVIVIVMSPEAVVAMSTHALLDHLAEQHINPRRLFLLSNRPNGTEDLTGQPLEDVVGRPIDMGWLHVGRNLSLANSRHAPYHLRFPEDTATLMLEDIASAILDKAGREGVPGLHA
ncbi:MAG: response regulator [Anaerolineales bacterium]|nr:response regulator [Anaerolineales bacterium]